MKRINKNGFTLVEMLAVVLVLGLILIISIISVHQLGISGKNKSFDVLVNTFKDSAKEAYSICVVNANSDFCLAHPLPDYDETDTVTLGELMEYDYIDTLKNPWNTKEKCDSTSTVKVTRTRKSQVSLTYEACLKCGTHSNCE